MQPPRERTQGSNANRQGRYLEQVVMDTLGRHGFEVASYREWNKKSAAYGDNILLRNVPFQSIYGIGAVTEFLIISKKLQRPVRIECKWQQVAGSVDEKFPYMYLNAIEAMPEQDIILLVDGGGYKPGAFQWLRDAVQNGLYHQKSKTVMVFGIAEF